MAHLDLRISPQIFEKIRNDPKVIFRGLGEDDSRKKTLSKKSRDTVPLTESPPPDLAGENGEESDGGEGQEDGPEPLPGCPQHPRPQPTRPPLPHGIS